jgi:uroporphyrinogen decarboxylase
MCFMPRNWSRRRMDRTCLTSRELVRSALRFERTERVPRQVWLVPWATATWPDQVRSIQQEFPDDIVSPPRTLPPLDRVRGDQYAAGQFTDEWGCTFVSICPGIIGEVKNPLVQNYATDLERITPPVEWVGAGFDEVNAFCESTDRFVLGGSGIQPFERMQYLRGTENLYIDLIERPAGFLALRDLVHQFNLRSLEPWLGSRVDGITWSDDWGSQQALLIDPDLWRELFKPLYREYVEAVHRAGKFAFMHSDGHIFAIYEDLIEIGVDAINSQLFCMDIDEIARRFKGRITFWGEICRQHLLPYATSEEIHRAVRRVADALYDYHGGVIAQCEFSIGSRPENVREVFAAWEQVALHRDSGKL